ncbi:MAG: lytic transglycosylase domain-containing protein [Rhodocyclaceae bacterium]|nr:lytic transglycosylase domain-containing protein [Rhodocyclaceae bacterium]MBX3670471.1 lytic transglycosylase domain-containing protein [Rhodocyclaceae bacterium]
MKKCIAGSLLACCITLVQAASSVVPANSDQAFLALREAFGAGDKPRFERLAQRFADPDLSAYVEYWRLRMDFDNTPVESVETFLALQSGSLIAERMRADLLKRYGKRGEWGPFAEHYALLAQPDQELQCYKLQARLAGLDNTALDDAEKLWLDLIDVAPGCQGVLEALKSAGRIQPEDVWARMRRLAEFKRFGGVRSAAGWLPDNQAPEPKQLDLALTKPERFLKALKPAFAASRRERELSILALAALARSDVVEATDRFERLADRYSAADRNYLHAQFGWHGAQAHLANASKWYKAGGFPAMSTEQWQWRVRAALRALDWRMVRDTIEHMPEDLKTRPDWQYWYARALEVQGKAVSAKEIFERLCGQAEFYGNLACDELERPITLPPRAALPTAKELDEVAHDTGVERALAFIRVDLRPEAVREWNWAMRGRSDRFLLAAAEYARRKEIYDRAISAADRTQTEHDYSLRFLAPFREQVEPKARERGLDNAWVYGLMRQESRFIGVARSSAGAQGLMQVMPSTAKYVAKKIGMDYHPGQATDLDTNVVLGTSYLRMVLDSLDDQPVLASAAYNAGPGRARRWRDSKPLEGAIYAETIPFNETRDYVKKVMSNAVYYSVLFGDKAPTLKERLGTIPAGN